MCYTWGRRHAGALRLVTCYRCTTHLPGIERRHLGRLHLGERLVAGFDPSDEQAALERIRAQVVAHTYRVTNHAQDEMDAENISLPEVLEVLSTGRILEDYPTFYKGPCCLIYGETQQGRPLHAVCTTAADELALITVYIPLPPKWVTPTQRR